MPDEQPPIDLRRLINGYQLSQALHVAAALGIADLLAGGERSAAELAATTQTHGRSLYRLLRALAAAGVLHEAAGERFALAPPGQRLRSDHPQSLAAWAEQIGRPYFWATWGHLLEGVRTGENAFRMLHAMDVWEYRSTRPDDDAVFNRAMIALSRDVIDAVIAAYDFSRFGRIVDVGGGHGALLAAILRNAPDARGVLFDQPHVVPGAAHLLREAGVADRCEVVAGDMFAAIPAGADAYAMKAILHDWDDARCTEVLRVVRAAMPPHGRLLVLEQIVAPPNEGLPGKLSDLNMFVMPGGLERTEAEFAALLDGAGLRLAAVTRTAGPVAIIEAAPA